MVKEIERLGRSVASMERLASEEGLDFARYFLNEWTAASRAFEEWFPRLLDFEREKRISAPLPTDSQLSSDDWICRRILEPKIGPDERAPHAGKYGAVIFTAPLAVLPLLLRSWPAQYPNPVFLTTQELSEWHSIYDDHVDAYDWCSLQHWDVEFDPTEDSFWMQDCGYQIPGGARSAIASWGLSWGGLAGGETAELWCIEQGVERLLGLLGGVTY